MSSNQILFGLGLVLVLAIGSQLVARVLRIPAIVVLLPAGFVAGAATGDVHPDNLLGSLYGTLRLDRGGRDPVRGRAETVVRRDHAGVRKAVVRLVVGGAALTWLAITATVVLRSSPSSARTAPCALS
jgi:NhaP-type Na+/H+ or K+/H+ antiporter